MEREDMGVGQDHAISQQRECLEKPPANRYAPSQVDSGRWLMEEFCLPFPPPPPFFQLLGNFAPAIPLIR